MLKVHRAMMLVAFALALSAAMAAQSSPTGALHWRSVGPFTGGRVWETDDYGHNWRNISDRDFKTGSIGAMAVAPSNSKIIYVGTGDSAPRNTVLTGEGMYKSTDGGTSWSFIGLGDTHMINWILVDPQNPDVVYVASLGHLFAPNPDRGVFKTTDGGQTWKKILFVNNDTGAITMAMDQTNPSVVYAAMWQMSRTHWGFSSGGPGSGPHNSTDAAANRTNNSHRPGLPTGIFGKVGVAVAPTDPKVVYALIQADYKGQAGGLFRSDDAGATWRLINNSMDITQRAFYYGRVYVDPK